MPTSRAIKERGILFSAPMVLAILAGLKTQTRRAVKPGASQRDWLMTEFIQYLASPRITVIEGEAFACFDHPKGGPGTCIKCPYGQVGDRLWVRETWQHYYFGGGGVNAPGVRYRADNKMLHRPQASELTDKIWRPSLFMPRWASRILLEITAVRVERLQAISDADAVAEGCSNTFWSVGEWKYPRATSNSTPPYSCIARSNYASLWQEINGPKSWDANPWVWVIEYKVI